MVRFGIGQDSHRFDYSNKDKKLLLGGIIFEGEPPLKGNSDADVVLHAITNAVSGITCVNILGKISDDMCHNQGITDSRAYLEEALKHLNGSIVHVSLSIECLIPKISPKIGDMRRSLSELLDLQESCIGITATTGEGLTQFGKGLGIQVFACVTVDSL